MTEGAAAQQRLRGAHGGGPVSCLPRSSRKMCSYAGSSVLIEYVPGWGSFLLSKGRSSIAPGRNSRGGGGVVGNECNGASVDVDVLSLLFLLCCSSSPCHASPRSGATEELAYIAEAKTTTDGNSARQAWWVTSKAGAD